MSKKKEKHISFEIKYIEPDSVKIERDPDNGIPRIEFRDDHCCLRVNFVCAFPFSDPDKFIGVVDSEGNEIGQFKTIKGMEPASKTIIEEQLDRRYFTPKVHVIYDMRREVDMWRCEVGSNRGDRTYFVRHWRDNAHEIGPNRWLVNTVDGSRFEIPSVEKLDTRSQTLLNQLS